MAGIRFTRDVKEPSPQLGGGSTYPESGLLKSPWRNTRAFSPAGMYEGKGFAPLSGAEEQTEIQGVDVEVLKHSK